MQIEQEEPEEEIIQNTKRTTSDKEDKARKLFEKLKEKCDMLTRYPKNGVIQYDTLKELRKIANDPNPVVDFLFKRMAIAQINKSDEIEKPKEITEQEFIDLFSGNDLRNLILGNKSPEEQRFSVEDFSLLFKNLGGTTDKLEIPKEKLKECITKYYSTHHANEDSNTACEEIFDLMTEKGDLLSLKDFMTIMMKKNKNE